MSKELYFTDGNNEVKYLDTTASFNLAITQDGSAFDLTNATAIDVKVANDTGYVFDKSIDMATIKQPLAGLITMPVDAEVMNALVPDDYTIEVWVTLSSLITPGSQEGLTDNGSTTTTPTTTTYNAIFPSDDPQGFTITDNVMSDSGDVIPVMSLDAFQQEFDQLKTDLTNQVSTLQGPAGKDGKDGATGPQGPQGIQGPKGDTGQGLEIKGKVDTTSQLPATASEGDGYLVAEELYIWTANAWKDCGQIQGPAGKDGKDGATGPQGPQGPAGKDGTQVDLSNYATKDQLATKADDSTVVHSTPTLLSSGTDLNTITSSGYYYIPSAVNKPTNADDWTIYQVVALRSSLSNGVQTAFDTNGNAQSLRTWNGKGWNSWKLLATTDDVTTAISTATANMVDSTKSTNFTAGLQSGGVDVATAADLKSIEDASWHRLDFGSDANLGGALLSSYIVYQVHEDEKYISFFYLGVSQSGNKTFPDGTTLMDLSSIVKGISSIDFSTRYAEMSDNSGQAANLKISGTKIITSTSSHQVYVTPNSTVSLYPLNHDERRIYYTELV